MGMTVNIKVKDWQIEEHEGVRRISGNFAINHGAMEIATQRFNKNEYGVNTKVLFSAALMADVEKINERIITEIQNNFTGGA
ncbi:MAG: hypothetical protein CSYNP_01620 [Syntrophus sp. SKADARSKE-3]|nr:hypothetical protein [Syntrophus sp. SKADARSKE-3]